MKDKEKEKEEVSLFKEVVDDKNKIIKWAFITISILMICVTIIVTGILMFLSGYTFETSTITVDSGESGTAIYQDGKGNTIDGKSD